MFRKPAVVASAYLNKSHKLNLTTTLDAAQTVKSMITIELHAVILVRHEANAWTESPS